MKRVLLTLALSLLCVSFAQNFTRYYADECETVPQEIRVKPAGLTYINFKYGVIDPGGIITPGINMGNANPQQQASLETQGGVSYPFEGTHALNTPLLNITSRVNSGTTDLTIWVDGEPCNFMVIADATLEGPQSYEVVQSRPLPSLTRELPEVNMNTTKEDFIRFDVIRALGPSNGNTSIFFSFTNVGQIPLGLDPTRLRFTSGGEVYGTSVRKDPRRLIVEPGETHSGTIIIEGSPQGQGEVNWAIQAIRGGGRELVINENVIIPATAR